MSDFSNVKQIIIFPYMWNFVSTFLHIRTYTRGSRILSETEERELNLS